MGMAYARQLILGQLGGGLANSINNLGGGMQEKDVESSNNNIISTDSNAKSNNDELLKISKTLNHKESTEFEDENDKFLEEDENKLNDSNHGEVNLSNTNINNMVFTIAQKGQKISMKNTLQLGGDFIKNNLYDSNYFVVYPNLKHFKIPGYGQNLEENNNPENKQKVQKELLIEDPNKIPDPQLFFKIGYMLKYQEGINPQESTKH